MVVWRRTWGMQPVPVATIAAQRVRKPPATRAMGVVTPADRPVAGGRYRSVLLAVGGSICLHGP